MNKQKKSVLVVFFCLFGCFFCTTCGLEEIVVLASPTVVHHQSYYDTVIPENWYCDFQTNETYNTSLKNASVIGTEVYYKIYKNYSNLSSHKSAIESVNSASNNTAAAKKLIETYTYQPLATEPDVQDSIFIRDSGENKNVYFRPKTYMKNDDIWFRAAIAYPHNANKHTFLGYDNSSGKISIKKYNYYKETDIWEDGETQTTVDYSTISFVVPYRNVAGTARSFDFFDYNNTHQPENTEPVDGDADYWYSESFTENYEDTYFVQFYAVAIAMDGTSLANTYSLVLDLGTIPIKKGE